MDHELHAAPRTSKAEVPLLALSVALLAALAAVPLRGAASAAQAVDRSQPPRVEASAGGFSLRRLDNPVTVDGKSWLAVEEIIGAKTVRAPNGQFAVKLEEASSVEVVHFRVLFVHNDGTAVLIAPGTAIYSFITPDSRGSINGTLEAIDVRDWRAYSLSKAFNIEPYVLLDAISADGRRLVISQRPCGVDCRFPAKYYEIEFPAG